MAARFDDIGMDATIPTQLTNRLRAAAGLVPIIEAGLARSTISAEKAALMSEFCLWAVTSLSDPNAEETRLADEVRDGLERIRRLLACPAPAQMTAAYGHGAR